MAALEDLIRSARLEEPAPDQVRGKLFETPGHSASRVNALMAALPEDWSERFNMVIRS